MKIEGISEKWLAIARDVIEAAKNRWSVQDYKRACRLHAPKIGEDFYYRTIVLDRMLQEGLVMIQDERLRLGSPQGATWLQTQLLNGSRLAWEFTEATYGDGIQDKFNADKLRGIGEQGEMFVVESYRKTLPSWLADNVTHVSLKDDSLGFDIVTPSVSNHELTLHVEVKTSVRPGDDFIFFLSRNEYEVAQKDRNWVMLLVGKVEGAHQLLGRLYCEDLEPIMPVDIDKNAQWASVRVRIDRASLIQGYA